MAETGESSYRRFLHGENWPFEKWIRTYSDSLVRYAYSLVRDSAAAEDIAAESFAARIVKKPDIRSPEHLQRFLYRCAHNKAMDYLRRRKNTVPLEDVENVLGTGDPSQAAQLKQRDRTVYVCMQSLPRDYREVLQLIYFEDLPTELVCFIMRKTKKQVYNLHAHSRTALRELLEKEGISHEDLR